MEKLYPEHMEAFGWNFDKNPDDFLIIAEMLEKEGQESRSKAIRYLVARVKESEKIARGKGNENHINS